MKKLTYSLLMVAATIFSSFGVSKVQIVHNDALPVLAAVDLYYISGTDTNKVANFQYREATSFLEVAHGTNLTLALTAVSNDPPAVALANPYISGTLPGAALTDGTNYYMIFNNLDVAILSGFPLVSGTQGTINLSFHNGASGIPLPATDVQVRARIDSNIVLFDDVDTFSVSTTIRTIPTDLFDFRIADTTGAARLASFEVDLRTAGNSPVGASALLFTSGQFGTANFALLAALPADVSNPSAQKATVVNLPLLNSARVQVIHASPDADSVQVYVDTDVMEVYVGARVMPTNVPYNTAFPYRAASAYLEVDWKANADAEVFIYNKDVTTELVSKPFTLTNGSDVVIVAAGAVADLELYEAPGKRFTDGGPGSGFLSTNVFHASPDAPQLDVAITAPSSAAGTLATGIEFGEYGGFTESAFESSFYTIRATASGAAYESTPLPLGLNPQANGLAFTLFVTGYVDPSANNNGPSLQLCAASLNGNPVPPVGMLCFDLVIVTSIEETVVNKMIMYPNPTQNQFNVEYTLESAQPVKYNVYNTMGQLILSGDEGVQNAGRNSVNVNVADLSTGQYVIQMLIGSEVNITRSFIKE